MTHTVFSNMTNRELLRMVDGTFNPTPLEVELAKRLEEKMKDAEFRTPTTTYVGERNGNFGK